MEEQPKWLRKELSAYDIRQIEEEVTRQEKKTSGEIVTVIVKQSAPYAWVPLTGFLIALSLSATGWLILQLYDHLVLQVLWVIASWAIGIGIAKKTALRRLLIPEQDRAHAVVQRAFREFHQLAIDDTRERTGIMIFLSAFEHQVVVLADKGIAQKLPAYTWEHVVEKLVKAAKEKRLGEGFVGAVRECGELLAKDFPIQDDDKNELHNHLFIKE